MKKITFLTSLLCLIIFEIQSQAILTQQTNFDTSTGLNSGSSVGQSFQVSQDIDVNQINFNFNHTYTGDITLYIYNSSNNIVASKTKSFSSATGINSIMLDTPYNLLKNTNYKFLLYPSTYLSVSVCSCAGYPNGQLEGTYGSGSYDMWFQVESSTAIEPGIETISATVIGDVFAEFGGNILYDGGAEITERGIVYSPTDATPEIGETNVIKDSNGTGNGDFNENITGLANTTLYYYRAYATNSVGISYGDVKSTTTYSAPPTLVNFNSESWTDNENHGSNTYTSDGFAFVISNGSWLYDTNDGEGNSSSLKVENNSPNNTITITAVNGEDDFDFKSFYYNSSGMSFINQIESFTNDGTTSNGIVADDIYVDGLQVLDEAKFTQIDKVVITLNSWYSSYSEHFDSFVFVKDQSNVLKNNTIESKTDFNIYPNPVKNKFRIVTNEKIASCEIFIYDVSGKIVGKYFNPNHSVDISNLPSGIYFVTLQSDKSKTTQKIIKL